MTFPDIKSLYDLPVSGNSASDEEHYVPTASPYQIILERTPQVSSNSLNTWVDVATAATYVQAWSWNGSSWDALTLVGTAPTSSTQFSLQCRDTHYVNSARVDLHSSLSGYRVKLTYDCFATAMDSNLYTTLQDHITRLENFIHLAPFSANTYSGGRFDGTVADDLTVYLSPSHFIVQVPPAKAAYAGATLDFSTGNLQITFTLADAYRNVSLYLVPTYNAVDEVYEIDVAISQGTEQVSDTNLPEAPAINGVEIFTIKARVISSTVQPITQAMITEKFALSTKPGIFVLSFLYDGVLVLNEPLDRVNGPGFKCALVGISIMGEALGTSGSTIINVKRYDTSDQTGTALFASTADMPTLAYDDTIYVPQASDMTKAEQDMLQVTATQSFQPFIQQLAGGTVENVRVNMYFEL
jgi:hypothetical protein